MAVPRIPERNQHLIRSWAGITPSATASHLGDAVAATLLAQQSVLTECNSGTVMPLALALFSGTACPQQTTDR